MKKLLLTYFLVAILPIIIIGNVSYYISSKTVIQQTKDYASLSVNQISKNIDSYIDKLERITYNAYSNTSIQKLLSTNHSDSFARKQENRDIIREFMLGVSILDKNIDGVYICSKYGEVFFENATSSISKGYDFKSEEWYDKISQRQSRNLLVNPHKEKKYDAKSSMNFSYIRALTDIYSGDYIGFLLVDINAKVLDEIVGEEAEKLKGEILITDEEGKVLSLSYSENSPYGLDKINLGTKIDISSLTNKATGKSVIISSKSEATGWEVVFITPQANISARVNEIGVYTALVAILCAVLCFIIATIISLGISRPVNRLKKAINRMENGDLDASVYIESNDEIGELSRSFNKMIKNIKALIKEVYETQLMKKEAELKALQSQINPHFMYNTLESLNMMAIIAGNFDISDVLSAFGDILRFNLDNKRNTIPISKEIQFIKNYIQIQKVRYKDKINVEFNISPEIMDYEVLKLTLQPIVENAIIHGVLEKEDASKITISAAKKDNNITFIVEDDGIGMTSQRLEDVTKSIENGESLSKEGSIGLNNIDERVKLYFGNKYGLRISSEPGKGTKVELVIEAKPFRKESRKDV